MVCCPLSRENAAAPPPPRRASVVRAYSRHLLRGCASTQINSNSAAQPRRFRHPKFPSPSRKIARSGTEPLTPNNQNLRRGLSEITGIASISSDSFRQQSLPIQAKQLGNPPCARRGLSSLSALKTKAARPGRKSPQLLTRTGASRRASDLGRRLFAGGPRITPGRRLLRPRSQPPRTLLAASEPTANPRLNPALLAL
jgi:hypothetical protein